MQKRRTADEVTRLLRDFDRDLAKGLTVPDICRQVGIAETTYWSAPQNLGHPKWESSGTLSRGGLHAEAKDRRRSYALAPRFRPRPGQRAHGPRHLPPGRHRRDHLLVCSPKSGPPEVGVLRYTEPRRAPCRSEGPPTKLRACSAISTATWPKGSRSPTSAARSASPRPPTGLLPKIWATRSGSPPVH